MLSKAFPFLSKVLKMGLELPPLVLVLRSTSGCVRLVYIPKWMRLPFRCCLCQSGDPLSASTLRSLDIWSLTSAFMG